jgi:hypothetical protein
MHHHRKGEPYAHKDQQARESHGEGIHDYAMPKLIVALRVFVFREVWDR